MNITSKPSAAVLHELLRYDSGTGTLFWRKRAEEWFSGGKYDGRRRAKRWNARHAGARALSFVDPNGYCVGRILGRSVKAHQVIWAMETGEWPPHIDHIDGDKTNNRFPNLRNVGQDLNNKNAARRMDNTSGVTGVSFDLTKKKWHAYLHDHGCAVHLGFYLKFDDAVAARRHAEQERGFHPNHGR